MKKNRHIPFLMLLLLASGCSALPDWMGESEKPPLEGTRVEILPTQKLTPDSDTTDIPVEVPENGVVQGWLQKPWIAETQMGSLPISETRANITTAKIGDGNTWATNLVPQLVADDNMVFAIDGNGVISAHDADDISKIIWEIKTSAKKASDHAQGGGLTITGGMLVAATGEGNILVVEKKSGKEVWKRELGLPLRTTPRVFNNRIFMITLDNQLLSLDLADGKLLWKHRGLSETTGILGAAAPAPYEDMVIVPYSSGEIYGLKQETGKEVWSDVVATARRESNLAKLSDVDADPVVSSGTVYVSGNSGIMSALDVFNGRRLWEREISALETPWIAGKFIYMTTTEEELIALHKDSGRIKWVVKLPEYEGKKKEKDKIYWSSPTLVDGRLLVAGNHGKLLLILPESGQIQRTVEVPNEIYTSPIVAYNRIFLVTRKAELVSVQ